MTEYSCTRCLWNIADNEGNRCALNENGPSKSCFVSATNEKENEYGKETD